MGADEDLINDSELSVHVDVQKHIVYHVRGNPNPWAETDRHTVEETWERVAAANGGFLGAGGFGQVFKEVCTQDSRGIKVGRYRAVKVIAKSGPWRDPHREGNTKALYKEELKALAKFSYPRYQSWFVMSFGWYEWADSIYITMEYIEHGDLQGYLSERFSEGDTRKIASQVIMGLIYMHEYGFIHRDLKPQNLLVVDKPPEKDWYVKISDFGISKQAVDGEDAFSTVIGTQEYSAPEVYLSKSSTRKASYTRAADMWSLGAICVRLMTGELPFDSRDIYTYYVSNGPFTPDDALRRCNISTAGRDFVQRLMARDASSRLTAMGAMEHNWISHGSQQSQIAPNKPAYVIACHRFT
ncbi:kinase-like protein [Parachaetomium inaequale]|uniref:non-specific serine/threonine protein kinase n=1 Tax=Parachaetomium inaequale TaxID=2588326 RepID=A0AAN6SV76_9PEZI|nr:kinase-like protein [Parachaetomium inaequale]